MPVIAPTSVDDAVAALAASDAAQLLAGGTDFMVEVNFAHRRPVEVVSLGRIAELRAWSLEASTVTIGAGVTWTTLLSDPLASALPALAEAARTVGSPQIRNAGTLGGNLATCSPAGDGLPVLSALDASVAIAGGGGRRTMSVHEFMVGVKRTALEPGELIVSITVPRLDGWQGYAKVGVRNAMVISAAGVCLAADRSTRTVRVALGAVAPTIIRVRDAEAWVADRAPWDAGSVDDALAREFGALVADAARPITDHRSTAEYRTHAVGVMAGRLLQRAFASNEGDAP
jgi:CO/xanthine dehydrogenase FAD-binding subunit